MFEQRFVWMEPGPSQKNEMIITAMILMDVETTELLNLVIPEWTFPHNSQVFVYQGEETESEEDLKIEMTTTFKTMTVEARLAK